MTNSCSELLDKECEVEEGTNFCKWCHYVTGKEVEAMPSGSDYRPHYEAFSHQVDAVCREISAMLIHKNRRYGNSALNPIRLFSKADALEQINVRLDDKLSRLQQSRPGEDEDVELDLIGYLFLRRIARKAQP